VTVPPSLFVCRVLPKGPGNQMTRVIVAQQWKPLIVTGWETPLLEYVAQQLDDISLFEHTAKQNDLESH
jgi:hypothetical protein